MDAAAPGVKKKKRRGLRIHIRRTLCSLKITNRPELANIAYPARFVLNDIIPAGIHVFISQMLEPGMLVDITVESPFRMNLKGQILSCQPHDSTAHIITERAFPYKAGIRFAFANDAEKDAVKKLCMDLKRDYILGNKAA
jgi:hypothetical protein